jgi:hypothetical protein
MAEATKSKPENLSISADNLRYVAGLNGFTVTDLAEAKGCSDALLYRAARYPEDYPAIFKWLNSILPRRNHEP